MIYIIQAFAAFLAALVISKTWNDFKQNKESLPVFIFWTGTWIIIIALAFFPQIIDLITKAFGGQITGMGRIFGMTSVFIFYVVYRVYLKADRIEKEMDQLVRNIALGKNQKKG